MPVKEKTGLALLPGMIRYKMDVRGVSREKLLTALRLTDTTVFTNRERNPEKYTVGEIMVLCNKLRFKVIISDKGVELEDL